MMPWLVGPPSMCHRIERFSQYAHCQAETQACGPTRNPFMTSTFQRRCRSDVSRELSPFLNAETGLSRPMRASPRGRRPASRSPDCRAGWWPTGLPESCAARRVSRHQLRPAAVEHSGQGRHCFRTRLPRRRGSTRTARRLPNHGNSRLRKSPERGTLIVNRPIARSPKVSGSDQENSKVLSGHNLLRSHPCFP